jgi:hypothetical protein
MKILITESQLRKIISEQSDASFDRRYGTADAAAKTNADNRALVNSVANIVDKKERKSPVPTRGVINGSEQMESAPNTVQLSLRKGPAPHLGVTDGPRYVDSVQNIMQMKPQVQTRKK